MALVTNPTTVTIGDPNISAQGVTSFKMLVGTATGGPYTTSTGTAPVSTMTVTAAGATCPFADFTFAPALASFTNYFAVTQAVNASGASGDSPEAEFQIQAAPSPPISFTLA